MISVSAENNSLVLSLVKVYANLNDTITFTVEEFCLSVRCLNKAHTAFFGCRLACDFFKDWSSSAGSYSVDSKSFFSILSRAGGDDDLFFSVDGSELIIEFVNELKHVKRFSLSFVDDYDDAPLMPQLDYSTMFKCDYFEFVKCIDDVALYCDILGLHVTDGRIIIKGEGFNGRYISKLKCVDVLGYVEDDFSNYSVELLALLKSLKQCVNGMNVWFGFSEEAPLMINLCDDDVDESYSISLIIAPRLIN